MRKFVGAICVIAAVFVVGCAAQQTAQDQNSMQQQDNSKGNSYK